MSFEYNGFIHRDLEPQVRYDAEQVQLLKQADVTINENLQTVNESLQTVNTELDGKLTKPANPSAESAVTMLADGTVGTKALSEIGGGGKLYLHELKITPTDSTNTNMVCYIYSSQSTSFVEQAPTTDLIGFAIINYTLESKRYKGPAVINISKSTFNGNTLSISDGACVCGFVSDNSIKVVPVNITYHSNTFTDTVVEL